MTMTGPDFSAPPASSNLRHAVCAQPSSRLRRYVRVYELARQRQQDKEQPWALAAFHANWASFALVDWLDRSTRLRFRSWCATMVRMLVLVVALVVASVTAVILFSGRPAVPTFTAVLGCVVAAIVVRLILRGPSYVHYLAPTPTPSETAVLTFPVVKLQSPNGPSTGTTVAQALAARDLDAREFEVFTTLWSTYQGTLADLLAVCQASRLPVSPPAE